MSRPRFKPDPALGGALSWCVYLDDNSLDSRLDAYLAISNDSLAVIDSRSREPVFAIPCSSILGWNTLMCNSLRIYYHQGECVTVHSKEPPNVGESDDLLEILSRLQVVTMGCETREFVLRRNELGQLGFHVQQDGIVTEVEPCGFAAKAGLTKGSRLVEICKVAVATLNQDQMIDFLKTSNTVVVMVIPALPDGSPRRGCDAKMCPFTMDMEGEYENLNLNGTDAAPSLTHHQFKAPISNSMLQQAAAGSIPGQCVPGNHRKRYEPRSFSPPRSSNSSGYGTGTSATMEIANDWGEVLTSSSSGISADDRWYDLTENLDGTKGHNHSPPPIPARSANTNGNIVSQSNGTPISRPLTNNNGHHSNNNDNTNIVGKGNGAGHIVSATHSFLPNGTAVIVVNNLTPASNSLNSNMNSNNNNNNNHSNKQSIVNGNVGNQINVGNYMTPTAFVTKRDVFQRNNPHHGSFHTKLSPSRSHDLLHLKSSYGLYHVKAFPSSQDDYGALSGSPNGTRIFNRNYGGGGLYTRQVKHGGNPYASPLENTIKGKVTYLTDKDFPLTHSHSSEYLVGYDNHGGNIKELTALRLKNERLEKLKSTYLEKHRERQYDHVDNDSNTSTSRYSAPIDSINGENLGSSEDDLNLLNGGRRYINGRTSESTSPKVSLNGEVKMRQGGGGSNSTTSRHSINRTLQEDLMKLIGGCDVADLIPTGNGQRPSSSSSVPITNSYGNLKARPISCGGEPTNYSSPTAGRNLNLSEKIIARNGHNHQVPLQGNSLRRATAEKEADSVTEEKNTILSATVPLPLPDSYDWSTLVDTATKAFPCCDMVVEGSSTITTPPLKLNKSTNSPLNLHTPTVPAGASSNCSSSSHSLLSWADDFKPDDSSESTLQAVPVDPTINFEALNDRVSQLEAELRKEQQSKQMLAAKVSQLEAELRKEQSTPTQHHFQKFSEWLRHTVEDSPSETTAHSSKSSGETK